MTYAIGDHVQYKDVHGLIRFIDDTCMTIMINSPITHDKECRIVVYSSEWGQLITYKQTQ